MISAQLAKVNFRDAALFTLTQTDESQVYPILDCSRSSMDRAAVSEAANGSSNLPGSTILTNKSRVRRAPVA